MPENKKNTLLNDEKMSKVEPEEERVTWSSKGDFFMTAISSAIGLGNIWRFPYKCYMNGGGAFLLAFVVMVTLVGFPLVCLDLALGQLGRCGPLQIWNICPAFEGVGWAIFGVDFVANIYYILLIALGLLYMLESFKSEVPWASCDNPWNTPACRDLQWIYKNQRCSEQNGSWFNGTCLLATNTSSTLFSDNGNYTTTLALDNFTKPVPPSEEFLNNHILRLSSGIEEVGGLQLPLFGCLLLAWILVFLGLSFGVRSWGKISYVTTLLPYVILVSLLIQTLLSPGSADGLVFFLKPDWVRLQSAKVWADAAVQAFFSLNCGGGVLITIGSHNKVNNNCFIDGIIVTISDFLTSMLCGIVVFAILGHLAHALQVAIPEVIGQGPGLAFVAYPEMLARMPVAPLWSALFMFMVFNLGLGSCMPIAANVQTILVERFPGLFSRGRRPLFLLVGLIVTWTLAGVILTSQAGMYILQMLDTSAPYVLVFTGLCKTIAVAWVYGLRRFIKDLGGIIGVCTGGLWLVTCTVTAPLAIAVVLVLNFVDYKRLTYGAYTFPVWADVVGWVITFLLMSAIPLTALWRLFTMDQSIPWRKRVRLLCSPSVRWLNTLKQQKETVEEQLLKKTRQDQVV